MSSNAGGDGDAGERPTTLPLLLAAIPCDHVLQERDGTSSVIRAIDQVRIVAEGGDPPTAMPMTRLRQTVYLSFLSGEFVGPATLTLTWRPPVGETHLVATQALEFLGENHKINIIGQLRLVTDQEGLHWFDVAIDGHEMTRFAIDLEYQPALTPPAS